HGQSARLLRRQHHRGLHLQFRPGTPAGTRLLRALSSDVACPAAAAAGPVRQACAMSGRFFALGIALVALATLPHWMTGVYYINVASQILFYAIFALGLNVLVGYGGLVSLGHAGLFGVTAYAVAYILQLGFGHSLAILGALVISIASMAVYAVLS